jgi:hypothetical protein
MKTVNIFQGSAKRRGPCCRFNDWAKAIESGCWGATPIRTRILVNVVNVVNEKKGHAQRCKDESKRIGCVYFSSVPYTSLVRWTRCCRGAETSEWRQLLDGFALSPAITDRSLDVVSAGYHSPLCRLPGPISIRGRQKRRRAIRVWEPRMDS